MESDDFFVLIAGHLARKLYEGLRKEASSLLIQRNFRMHFARKAYRKLYASVVSIQTGMRVMAACRELNFRRRNNAAIVIQVGNILKNCDYKIFKNLYSHCCS